MECEMRRCDIEVFWITKIALVWRFERFLKGALVMAAGRLCVSPLAGKMVDLLVVKKRWNLYFRYPMHF